MRTIRTAIDGYFRSRSIELRPASIRTLREDLRSVADSTGPGLPVRQLRWAHLDTWLQTQRHLAPSTLQKRLSTVRVWCRWMVCHEWIRADPSTRLPTIRRPRTVPRALESDQVAATLARCHDTRTRLAVCLMVQEGLRRGEVARLQRGDIRLREKTMVVIGKGDAERPLPITTETRRALAAYLRESPGDAGPLIRSRTDPHAGLSGPYVSKLVRDAMRAANVRETPHALRHTAASDVMDMGGANIRQVQRMLGHASVTTTEIYLRLDVSDLRPVMDGREYTADHELAPAE